MDSSGGATTTTGNWTELVEDLLHDGEIDQATSILESTVSNLEKQLLLEKEKQPKNNYKISYCSSIADQLSTALQDLSKLYSAKGLSLKADQAISRAIQIKHQIGSLLAANKSISDGISKVSISYSEATTSDNIAVDGFSKNSSSLENGGNPQEDDWEAIADHPPVELLSQQSLPGISKLSLDDSKDQSAKRRGRGTFSYKKQGLYSDNQSDELVSADSENNSVRPGENPEVRNLMYGTRHVLMLADFPPSTRTTDLEKLLGKFKEQFVIRWVNDTLALAVFRTPSIALEASNSIQCSFKVCVLDESNEILSLIPPKDLKPPRQRPQTSARTAQRLIAQSMGIKLPSSFGSTELRKQEEERKNRIVSRQNMRDDAWGGDDV